MANEEPPGRAALVALPGEPSVEASPENVASQPGVDWLRPATPPWKPWVSGLLGFLFGPVSAAIVSYVSLRRLGAPRKAAWVLALTLVGCAPLGALPYLYPDAAMDAIFQFIGNAVSPLLYPALQRRDFTNWQKENPTSEPRSAWRAVAWGPVGFVVFLALGLLGASPWLLTEKVEGIELSWEFPNRIVAGEEFRLELGIHNTADTPQLLKVMNLDQTFLRHISILSTEPGFKRSDTRLFPPLRSYTFDIPIPPGEVLRIEVQAMPKTAGEHRSDLGLCITSETNCMSWDLTIEAREANEIPAPVLEGAWGASDEGCVEIYTEKELVKGIDQQQGREKRKTQLVFSGDSFSLNTVDCSDGSTRTHFRGTFVIGNKTTNEQGIAITEMDLTGEAEDGQHLANYTSYYLKDDVFVLATYVAGGADNGGSPENRTKTVRLENAEFVLFKR
jgi:hypothetical protein